MPGMVRFTSLLLGARLRLIYNSLRRARPLARIGWVLAGLTLFGMGAFSGFVGYGLARLPALLQNPELRQALIAAGLSPALFETDLLVRSFLSLLVLAVWGIVLLGSLGAALNNFYLASDLDLLVAAPIPMRAIFAAKFLEGLGWGYLLLFALGGPALMGIGIGAHYPWPYFLGVVLVLLLLPLVPESVGTLLVMPLVRLIPPKRLREVLQGLGALVGAAFYFFSQFADEADPQTAGRLVQGLQHLDFPLWPQSWVARGLTALGRDQVGTAFLSLGAFLGLSLGLYALCLLLAERLYYSGWAHLQTAPKAARPRRVRKERPAGEVRLLPRPIRGLLVKDLRLFFREPEGWTDLLLPLAGYAMLAIQIARRETTTPAGLAVSTAISLSNSGLVLLLAATMFSRLGLGGIGTEGKQFWLLQTAPVPLRYVLWAKFLAAYLPLLLVGGLMQLGLALIGGHDWGYFLGHWLLLALVGVGIAGISVGVGASFPRLDAESRQRAVSLGAGCLFFPLVAAYTGVVVALVLLPPLVTSSLDRAGLSFLSTFFWVVCPTGAVALTALALWVPLRIGAGRLAALEVG